MSAALSVKRCDVRCQVRIMGPQVGPVLANFKMCFFIILKFTFKIYPYLCKCPRTMINEGQTYNANNLIFGLKLNSGSRGAYVRPQSFSVQRQGIGAQNGEKHGIFYFPGYIFPVCYRSYLANNLIQLSNIWCSNFLTVRHTNIEGKPGKSQS